MMSYLPGQIYKVPCAEIALKEDGRLYYLPVIDMPHSDPGLDFPYRHYHIDGRFDIHPRMLHRMSIQNGYTATIILTEGTSFYHFKGIVQRELLCKQITTGLAIPPESEKYRNWYEGFIGRSCAGRKCPHLHTEMLEQDGRLICPLHGITADPVTLKVVLR